MTAAISSTRLELCRLVREHCYQIAGIRGTQSGDVYLRDLAQAALEVPIDEMADWFVMSDTVLANLRLAMTMTEQRVAYYESLVH